MDLKCRLYCLPIATSIWILLTFAVSYAVAVLNEDISIFFPYISDTGALPPESCVFGQMLNIGAVLLTMYVRFKVVDLQSSTSKHNFLNKISNLFGFLSCLGISLVANFQETSVATIHFIGAFLAFAVGSVYCLIQAYISVFSNVNRILKCLRVFFSLFLLPLYVAVTICTVISFQYYNQNPLKWKKESPAFSIHLAATFSEWVMAILMIAFITTFYVEFRLVKFENVSFTIDK